MSRRLVKIRSVRGADGKPSMLPRVSNPADALSAPGWTVYTEPSPLLVGVARLARWLLARSARGLVGAVRLLVAVTVRGVAWVNGRGVPVRRLRSVDACPGHGWPGRCADRLALLPGDWCSARAVGGAAMSRPAESGCSFAEVWRSQVDGLWVAHLVIFGPHGEIVRSRRLGKHETPAAALATIVVTLVLLHETGRRLATPGGVQAVTGRG